jgi:hypothetical protein
MKPILRVFVAAMVMTALLVSLPDLSAAATENALSQGHEIKSMQHSAVPYVVGYLSIGSMLVFTGFIITDVIHNARQGKEHQPVVESKQLVHESLYRARYSNN